MLQKTSLNTLWLLGAVTIGTALIPTLSFTQAAKDKSTTEDVSNWSQEKWNAAKAEWMKEKAKWASCNKQATKEKLSGRKSWSFLYTCMTK